MVLEELKITAILSMLNVVVSVVRELILLTRTLANCQQFQASQIQRRMLFAKQRK